MIFWGQCIRLESHPYSHDPFDVIEYHVFQIPMHLLTVTLTSRIGFRKWALSTCKSNQQEKYPEIHSSVDGIIDGRQ